MVCVITSLAEVGAVLLIVITEATMFVNPAALIAAAIVSASAVVPAAVNDNDLAVSSADVPDNDSASVNVFAPLSVPLLIILDVILVL